MRKYIAALFIFSTVSGCDLGDPMQDLEGTWKFKTDRFSRAGSSFNNNILSGNLIVGKMVDGERSCKLSVTHRQELRNIYSSENYFDTIITQQKCFISMNRNAVTIISSIIESSSNNYLPDNFSLTYRKNYMKGKLESGVNTPVTFVKSGEDGEVLPATLWDSDEKRAKKDLKNAKYFITDDQGCVHGIRDIQQSDDVWRKAELNFICDGEYNGQPVRSQKAFLNVNCDTLSTYHALHHFYGTGDKLIGQQLNIDTAEIKKFGPHGILATNDKHGDVFQKFTSKVCS